MALLHHAELTPSKLEFIGGWAPSQPWFDGDADAGLTTVAAFRFDDPDGEVGVETLLVRAGDGPTLQIPVTYRDAPLPGGDAWLIGTLEHSVLGTRWVYDGVGDPVYLVAVATAALTGGRQADMFFEVDGERVPRDPTALVVGSGSPGASVPSLPSADEIAVRFEHGVTVVEASTLTVVVARVVDGSPLTHPTPVDTAVLTGTWTGQSEPQPLVWVSTR